ncbi:acyl carrier protein [Nonomuraea mesophila]|uniref:Acyl carrier protein n=1 Tax=Nonomuraea mesophila TaxID=2530382 RepID=A0A4R5ECP4_9ACTN|nr:acyl carrier protein [Nonomuraea mesophila]TDE31055.1 acyl carrier protein [Nonomuraea mesophila]
MDGELRERLAGMIAEATDGAVDPAEVMAGRTRLSDLGVTSLAFLRLIDAVETEFGVQLEPTTLDGLDELVDYVRLHG